MDTASLESLGYDEWFQNAAHDRITGDQTPARVIEVNKGNYRISDGLHEMVAELSGKFLYTTEDPTQPPTVGDWVVVQMVDDFSLGIIHDILPRKSVLKRKESGRKVDFQLIASNIDYGLVVQSATTRNLNSLERYLVMLNESAISPILVLSKRDLLAPTEIEDVHAQMSRLNTRYVLVSTMDDHGIEPLTAVLESGKTYCLLGPSGVGKTSLLNRLLGEELFRVNEVREKDGRGRHTTVRRQLVRLDTGSVFVDTPGMRELGNIGVAEGIQQTFDEITEYGSHCRFRDCTHTHEEGCAIIEAVENGIIDGERYRNYLKIRKESDFLEMSYQQRRKKDKAFGRMVKSY